METPERKEVRGQTPEDLERLLDAQIAIARAKRKSAEPKKQASLAMLVLFMFVAAGMALVVLCQLAEEKRAMHHEKILNSDADQRR